MLCIYTVQPKNFDESNFQKYQKSKNISFEMSITFSHESVI